MIDVRLFIEPDLIADMPEPSLVAILGELALSAARMVEGQ